MITRFGQDYEEMGPAPQAIMTMEINAPPKESQAAKFARELKETTTKSLEKLNLFAARAKALNYPSAEANRIIAKYITVTDNFDEACHLDLWSSDSNAFADGVWATWNRTDLTPADKEGYQNTIRGWIKKWGATSDPSLWEKILALFKYDQLFTFTSVIWPESYWRAHEINAARNITQYIKDAPAWIDGTAEAGRAELRKRVLETLAKMKPDWKNEVKAALIPPFMEAYEADKLAELAALEMTAQQEKTAKVIGIGLVAAFGVFFATKLLRKKAA